MRSQTTRQNWSYKRILIFLAAIFFCGLGIAVTTRANLGTTPISSLPYVLTFMLPLSFGVTTFIVNMLFIGMQLVLLRREFKRTDYFQIVVTLFFSFFIDLGMYLTKPLETDNYLFQLLMLVVGSAILALGVMLETVADVSYVPGEGVVKAAAYKMRQQFGKMKIAFDVFLCVSAVILSVVVLHGIQGLREGTVAAAFLVGAFVCLYARVREKFKSAR